MYTILTKRAIYMFATSLSYVVLVVKDEPTMHLRNMLPRCMHLYADDSYLVVVMPFHVIHAGGIYR